MIMEIDYRDERYPLNFRKQLAIINWDDDIAYELIKEMDDRKNKIIVLLDEEIKELVKIYKWWFSEDVMYSKFVIKSLNEYVGVLSGFFRISNIQKRYDEVDKHLEEILLNKWLSFENIWNFLVWKTGRWFYDDMMEDIHEFDEEWNPILFKDRDENIRAEIKYITENLQEILNYINDLNNEKTE